MFYHTIIIFIISYLLQAYFALAQNQPIVLTKDETTYLLGKKVDILGYTGKLDLIEVLLPNQQARFEPSKQERPSHGFSTLNYWFKVKLVGKADAVAGKEWLLQMKNPNIDTLDVYFLNERNEIIHSYHTGDRFPFKQRPILYHKFSFPIPFQRSETIQVYIHAHGYYAKGHDLLLVEKTTLFNSSQYGVAFAFFLNTILVVLILYNLLLYFSLRDASYFYYIAYLSCTTVHLIATTGLGYQFLYPEFTTLANYIANMAAVLAASFALLFAYHFLKIKELLPKWIQNLLFILSGYGFLLFIWLLIAIQFPWHLPYIMTSLAIQLLLTLIWILVVGFGALRKGSRPAIFFLIAWGAMFLGTTLSTLSTLVAAWWEMNAFFNDYGVQIGSALEALLLSLGLADKIKIMEREKIEAQQTTIKALKENEEIIREQNKVLEQRVKERTLELAELNDELATFNEELNQTNEELQTALEIVNEQKLDIEEKNKAIMDSITYAKRIQDAILPTSEDFQHYLPQSFVFFQPRDVVSGDFYLLEEKNGFIVVAAVDCTGHGVPGAFMSMIGKELFDQIITDYAVVEADIILNELHKGVRKALKQNESDNRDGMDLVLLVINPSKTEVQFAGAKNSLLYVQNSKMHKLKGDIWGIGGEQQEIERVFTKHIISITSPTTFYLFTDGFQDQFGGEARKKFSFSRLKELLNSVHEKDMNTQKMLIMQNFEEWKEKGKEKQIDDVLLMGVVLG